MRIGAFSKYVKTTVKTLRYYDKIGLFCPAEIDPQTGYRNYTAEQLTDFERIRQYRAAGFSVEQIKRMLSGGDITALLQEQKRELLQKERLLRQQKEAITALMQAPNENAYTILFKELPSYTVCSCRARVSDIAHITAAASDLLHGMQQQYPALTFADPSYCCVTFTDTSYRETDLEIEYAEAVTEAFADKAGFVFKTLSGGTVACVEHHGPYETIASAYAALLRFLTANGFPVAGAVRERFIHGAWDRENEAEWLTEIQVPIEGENP